MPISIFHTLEFMVGLSNHQRLESGVIFHSFFPHWLIYWVTLDKSLILKKKKKIPHLSCMSVSLPLLTHLGSQGQGRQSRSADDNKKHNTFSQKRNHTFYFLTNNVPLDILTNWATQVPLYLQIFLRSWHLFISGCGFFCFVLFLSSFEVLTQI